MMAHTDVNDLAPGLKIRPLRYLESLVLTENLPVKAKPLRFYVKCPFEALLGRVHSNVSISYPCRSGYS